jgi:hypothetical protein
MGGKMGRPSDGKKVGGWKLLFYLVSCLLLSCFALAKKIVSAGFASGLAHGFARGELEALGNIEIDRHSLNPVVPHRVLQQLLGGADHFLHSHSVFVDLECWNRPHVFCACNGRALVYIHLFERREENVKVRPEPRR